MAEGSQFPLAGDPAPSFNEVGVQMPGPMSGGDEVGFDAIGGDMHWQAPMGEFPVGVQMPGGAPSEVGWKFGEDMAGMAAQDEQPMNYFGVESDDGDLSREDFASSAGFRVIGPMTGNTGALSASDILPAFDALEDNASGVQSHGSGSGSVPGMDSLRGIPLDDRSGPVGDGGASAYNAPLDGR